MQLVRPGPEHVASYVAALERGWSADNERGIEAAREELSRIQADAAAFLASMEITTDPDNIGSQHVIEANGGIFVEHFIKPQQFGSKPGLRFRIMFR